MIHSQAIAPDHQLLSNEQIIETIQSGLDDRFSNQRVLVLIPDHTRSLPLPFLFRALVEILQNTKQLDFMVALGTHLPLSEESINRLVGITLQERNEAFKHIGLFNHAWNDPTALSTIGTLEGDEIKQIAGAFWHTSLPNKVDIRINKLHSNTIISSSLVPRSPMKSSVFQEGQNIFSLAFLAQR